MIAAAGLLFLITTGVNAGWDGKGSYYMGEKPITRRPGETVQEVQERQARPGLSEAFAFPSPAEFHNARYHLAAEPGRILVEASLAVTADSHTFVALPVKGLALCGVTLDREAADLLPAAERILVRVPAGRHEVRIRGALAVQRGRDGAFTEWTPGFPGAVVPSASVKIDGNVTAGEIWVTGATPVKIGHVVSGNRSAGGSWTVGALNTFTIGRGLTTCRTEIKFEAFGAAPETFAVRLPRGFAAAALEGDAQEVEASGERIVIAPTADVGRCLIRSEAITDSGELDLSGLRIENGGRVQLALALARGEGVTTALGAIAGVAPDGDTWRITAADYRFCVAVQRSEQARLLASLINRADLTLSMPAGEYNYGRLRLQLGGKPANFLGLTLPEGSELLSVLAGGNAVAPMRSAGVYRIPLRERTDEVEIVFRKAVEPASTWKGAALPVPRFDLPVSRYGLTAWIPEERSLFFTAGPWRIAESRFTFLRLCEAVADLGLALAWWGGLFLVIVIPASLLLAQPEELSRLKRRVTPLLAALTVLLGVAVAGLMTADDRRSSLPPGTFESSPVPMSEAEAAPAAGRDESAAEDDEAALRPAAPQPAVAARHDGGVSIAMEIPLSGRQYRFERIDPEAAPLLRMWTMPHGWCRGLALLFCAASGLALAFRPAAAAAVLGVSGLSEFVLPGMLAAAVAGIAAVAVLGQLRRIIRKARVLS